MQFLDTSRQNNHGINHCSAFSHLRLWYINIIVSSYIMAEKVSKTADIDSGTLLGIISLLVAVLSTLVCVGQVLQQYIATGNPIRLCDTIVYGGKHGLPGTGTSTPFHISYLHPC